MAVSSLNKYIRRSISEDSEEIYVPLMRETGVEVSVLCTPSNVAVLTAWLSRSLS